MRRVAIFGYSGLIGSDLVGLLNEKEIAINAFGRRKPEFSYESFRFVDLEEAVPSNLLEEYQIDAIIYLAQSREYKNLPSGLSSLYFVNTFNPHKIAKLAHDKGTKFLYASTGSVYKGDGKKSEDSPNDLESNLNPYPMSKLQAEQLIKSVCPRALIVRPFTVFGINMDRRMMINRIADAVISRSQVSIPKEGFTVLTPTPSLIAAQAILHLMDSHEGVFNVAGVESLSIQELARKIGKSAGVAPIFKNANDNIAVDLTANTAKLKNTNFVPSTNLDTALEDFVKEKIKRR